jgi:hypothetical protein
LKHCPAPDFGSCQQATIDEPLRGRNHFKERGVCEKRSRPRDTEIGLTETLVTVTRFYLLQGDCFWVLGQEV